MYVDTRTNKERIRFLAPDGTFRKNLNLVNFKIVFISHKKLVCVFLGGGGRVKAQKVGVGGKGEGGKATLAPPTQRALQ